MHELMVIDRFVRDRGETWHPADDSVQHYSDDTREFLGDARRAFDALPAVLEGLRAYEEEVADLLLDEP